MLYLEELLDLRWDIAHQVKLKLFLANQLASSCLVLDFIVVVIVHVDEIALALLKG